MTSTGTITGTTPLPRGPEGDAALRRLAALIDARDEAEVPGTGAGAATPAPAVALASPGDALAAPPQALAAPPWAEEGDRPERRAPERPDLDAWDDPPWWRRVRWAPDRLAGVALVVAVLVLGGVAVHRLAAAAPGPATPVPQLPSATPGVPVPGAVPAASAASPAAPPAAAAGAPAPAPGSPIVVSVVGFVERSGLVTLAPGARVSDALDAAGGVRPGGDREGLNLARRVADGEQLLVGVAPGPEGPRGPRSGIVGPEPAAAGGAATPAGGPAAPGPAAPPGGPAPAAAAPGAGAGTVNLNTADATQLDALPGVGPATAAAILSWRAAHGPFTSVDQLTEVDGIGPASLTKLRPHVTV